MPLGDYLGDKSDSRYCGVEIEFNNINGGFDFVVAPLMEPGYRHSFIDNANKDSSLFPFHGLDLVLSPSQWSSHVFGKISSWIDLELWNSFRVLCEHHSQLSIAPDVLSSLPSANSLGRCVGEPVKSAFLHTDSFLTNAWGYPWLSKRHQNMLSSFF